MEIQFRNGVSRKLSELSPFLKTACFPLFAAGKEDLKAVMSLWLGVAGGGWVLEIMCLKISLVGIYLCQTSSIKYSGSCQN